MSTHDDLVAEITESLVKNWRRMHTNTSRGFQEMLAEGAVTAIEPLIEQRIREARAAALRHAADDIDDDVDGAALAFPWMAIARSWLSDRADQESDRAERGVDQ